MRYVFFIAIAFCGLGIKAQTNQAKPLKFPVTDEMQEKMDNDTTGKYRIGIPPKKVIDAANKKAEADKIKKEENTTNNNSEKKDAKVVGPPTNAPKLTKEDSLKMAEEEIYVRNLKKINNPK